MNIHPNIAFYTIKFHNINIRCYPHTAMNDELIDFIEKNNEDIVEVDISLKAVAGFDDPNFLVINKPFWFAVMNRDESKKLEKILESLTNASN